MFQPLRSVIAILALAFVLTASLNAQIDIDKSVGELAAKKGLTQVLEKKRKLYSQLQVKTSAIRVNKLGNGKVELAPYCSLDLGEVGETTEWMVNKTPPLFVTNINQLGSLIVTVLPVQPSNVTANDLYKNYTQKIFKKLKIQDHSELKKHSESDRFKQFVAEFSGQNQQGKSIHGCVCLVMHENFVLLIQGMTNGQKQCNQLAQLIESIRFDVKPTSGKNAAKILVDNSVISIPSPHGLRHSTTEFPLMVREMDRLSAIKVNNVFVEPNATQSGWTLNGLYRHADARNAGKMNMIEFVNVKREFEKAIQSHKPSSDSPVVKMHKINGRPSEICYLQMIKVGNKTRVSVAGMWYHQNHLLQFCVHSDLRTEKDVDWAKETMRNWLSDIRIANN